MLTTTSEPAEPLRHRDRAGDATGARHPVSRRAHQPGGGWASLTPAERRVAREVADGCTNAEAGERLCISRHTVDAHLRQIYRKLGVHSRVKLARVVLLEG